MRIYAWHVWGGVFMLVIVRVRVLVLVLVMGGFRMKGPILSAGYNLGLISDRSGAASTSSSSSSQQHHSRGGSYGGGGSSGAYAPHDERQEFSSAFGLMSLDDPNVIAGLAVDGQPFFSDPEHAHNQQARHGSGDLLGQDMDTPMPMKQESSAGGLLQLPASGLDAKLPPLPTPSRETDTRELREFWKQYMRTPLSGPGPAASGLGLGESNASSTTTASNKGVPPYRRPRVASLPSAKTPVMERDHFYSDGQPAGNIDAGEERGRDGKMGPMSSIRTTLHGNHEDLRSYEAAVLARKAPTNLNLQIRKPIRGRGNVASNYGARPRSAVDPSTSSISSLANAFGGSSTNTAGSTNQHPAPPSAPAGRVTFAMKKEESASPSIGGQSRGSSLAVDDSDGGSSNDQDSLRPSFKRLPSQTLGPANSKRAFLGFAGEGNQEGSKDRQLVGWGAPTGAEPNAMAAKNALLAMSHPDRVVASLSERRRRRMSAPGASSPLHLPLPDSNRNSGLPEQKMSGRPYAGDAGGAAGYAPAAQAGGTN
ncbi:hypothetical protein CVT25_008260 [Psilocybe cyanescens]|uniref:Uncharacterized protein n=1 Tax=Psilocybe cyanescens TaxID=93625 RepID=A0A409XMX5_PSICY|nr:hypothetical protein CVT25_008260 [Psilocybe cyanescens]